MVKHKPWKFYYCSFVTADKGRRFAYVGAANRLEVADILFDLNGYLTDLHITLLGLQLLKNRGGKK
jgi:hypothetical protein